MALRLKSVFFGGQRFVFDCQNLLLFQVFTINCLLISFLSDLWDSDDLSILVTRKNPKGLANLLIILWRADFKLIFSIFSVKKGKNSCQHQNASIGDLLHLKAEKIWVQKLLECAWAYLGFFQEKIEKLKNWAKFVAFLDYFLSSILRLN